MQVRQTEILSFQEGLVGRTGYPEDVHRNPSPSDSSLKFKAFEWDED